MQPGRRIPGRLGQQDHLRPRGFAGRKVDIFGGWFPQPQILVVLATPTIWIQVYGASLLQLESPADGILIRRVVLHVLLVRDRDAGASVSPLPGTPPAHDGDPHRGEIAFVHSCGEQRAIFTDRKLENVGDDIRGIHPVGGHRHRQTSVADLTPGTDRARSAGCREKRRVWSSV